MHRRSRSWSTLALLVLAAPVTACGSGRDAMEKRLSSLQEDVTRLQNSNDRLSERLQALEIQRMQARASAPEPKERELAEPREVRPKLKVVKMGPGATESAPDEMPVEELGPPAEESGPRPVIKDYGTRPTPSWAPKLGPKAGAPAPRAAPPTVGQNQPQGKPRGT